MGKGDKGLTKKNVYYVEIRNTSGLILRCFQQITPNTRKHMMLKDIVILAGPGVHPTLAFVLPSELRGEVGQ